MLRDAKASTLFAFWDPNQDLYGGGLGKDLGFATVNLNYNCRNTKCIGEFAGKLVGEKVKFRPSAPEGDAIERIVVDSAAAMADAVRRVLHRIIREQNVPSSAVVLLSPCRRERSALPRDGKVGPFTLIDLGVEKVSSDQVRFSTIHGFKGLEADVVVICDLENLSDRNVRHVGASRAKHYLVEIFYEAGPVPI